MHIDVVEFELTCTNCGVHKTITPVEAPRPHSCVQCFLPVANRRELRRYTIEGPLPAALGSEAWIG